MNISTDSSFHRYLNSLVYISTSEKSLWHLTMNLHQMLCRSHALLIKADVCKNHLAENLTNYWSKDYYHLSIWKASSLSLFQKILNKLAAMILFNNFWLTVFDFSMNRYYVSFFLFVRETFTLEAVLRENCQ